MSTHSGAQMQHLVALTSRDMDQMLLEQLGIGLAQYKIMSTIHDHPHVQQRTIADTLGQTEASVSRQIKLLAEKALLHAEQNPTNKREHITDLTPNGVQIVDAAERVLGGYQTKFFAGLSDKQQQQLDELLGVLHRSVCYHKHPGVDGLS